MDSPSCQASGTLAPPPRAAVTSCNPEKWKLQQQCDQLEVYEPGTKCTFEVIFNQYPILGFKRVVLLHSRYVTPIQIFLHIWTLHFTLYFVLRELLSEKHSSRRGDDLLWRAGNATGSSCGVRLSFSTHQRHFPKGPRDRIFDQTRQNFTPFKDG